MKEELLEEVKKDFKEEIKDELRAELKDELTDELRGELKEELKEEIRKELKEELTKEITDNIKADLIGTLARMREDLFTSANEGMKMMKRQLHQEVYDELWAKARTEIATKVLNIEKMISDKYKSTHASTRIRLPFPNIGVDIPAGTPPRPPAHGPAQTLQQRPPSQGTPHDASRRTPEQRPLEKQGRRAEESSQTKEQEKRKQRRISPVETGTGTSSSHDAYADASKRTSRNPPQDRGRSATADASQQDKTPPPPPPPKRT